MFHVLLLFQKCHEIWFQHANVFVSSEVYAAAMLLLMYGIKKCIVREENGLETVNIKFKKLSVTFNMKSNGIFYSDYRVDLQWLTGLL